MRQYFHSRVGLSAICALALSFAFAPAALARQQAASSDQKASTPKTSAVPHHTSASKSATKSTGSSHTASNSKHSSKKKKATRVRGQKKIDSERARTIQEALIREHYLSGEPTGDWNDQCEEAMRRYQSDHGWQTKEVPDSRALIKLGLGPGTDHLLNPESAMTTAPDAPRSQGPLPTSHSATPATVTPAQKPAQSDPPNPQ